MLVFSCSFQGLWGHSGQECVVETAISSFNFRASEAGVKAQIKASLKDHAHFLKLNTHAVVGLESSAVPISLRLELSLLILHTNLVSVCSLSPVWTELNISIGTEAKD